MISQHARLLSPIAPDVINGLRSTPKTLPAKLFYDAAGSELFEEITRLPEYYLTRTEQAIFNEYADDIVRHAIASTSLPLTLIELGAGTATKTSTIIAAILHAQPSLTFFPLDVSPAALQHASAHLTRSFQTLTVNPIVADYTHGVPPVDDYPLPPHHRKLVLYIGSSIGNFEPMQASAILSRARHALSPGDALLLGTDLAKSEDILLPAYDDQDGVTARFNKNILVRINRELGGHFDLDSFVHVALWNARESRIEMHLESLRDQLVSIDNLRLCVQFARGERIHTENSYKFTSAMIDTVLSNAGFRLERTWTDPQRWFALHLARVS